MTPQAVAHRAFLRHEPGFRPFRGSGIFERIGGQVSVHRLVDVLYAGFERDPELAPLFARNLGPERARQKLFFAEWLGGEPRYSQTAWSGLAHRHEDLPITRALSERWLAHFLSALEAAIPEPADRATLFDQARALALALVNTVQPLEEGEKPSRHRSEQVAACSTGGGVAGVRQLKLALTLVQRGDRSGVERLIEQSSELVERPMIAAQLLQSAALAGRAPVVELLVERGTDANKPHFLPLKAVGSAFERVLFVTPLCAARMKRRTVVESVLLRSGARDDLFSAAFLGDLSQLSRILAAERTLSQVTDPALDVLCVTPIHHAIAGGQVEALRQLLAHTSGPLEGDVRALRGAAAREDRAMVELLLERDADATQIGAGRWVLDSQISALLAERGASVGTSGAWIAEACTGNHGRKDDPDYVRALLRHGARATDRRSGVFSGGSARELEATALHYAVKSGFVRTVELLLSCGADPNARDREGCTALDWLATVPAAATRAEIRRLLEGK